MQKSDVIVASVGALIVLVATVGVAVTGTEALAREYRVAVAVVESELPAGSQAKEAGATSSSTFTFDAPDNVSRVTATVLVSSSAFQLASDPALRVVLRSPAGNETEVDTECSPVGCTAVVVLLVALPPSDHTFVGGDDADADATVAALSAHANGTVGEWSVVVDFSAGAVPLPDHEVSWGGSIETWAATWTTVVPASR